MKHSDCLQFLATIILSFVSSCHSNFDQHDKFDAIKNVCGKFDQNIENLSVVSFYTGDKSRSSITSLDIVLYDKFRNPASDFIISNENSCIAFDLKTINKISVKNKIFDEGGSITSRDLSVGLNNFYTHTINTVSFDIVESCGNLDLTSPNMFLFKAINTDSEKLYASLVNEDGTISKFNVNNYGCVAIPRSMRGLFKFEDQHKNFGSYSLSLSTIPNQLNLITMRPPLTNREICEGIQHKKWVNEQCIDKDFSELYNINKKISSKLDSIYGTDGSSELFDKLSIAEEIIVKNQSIDDLSIFSDKKITPSIFDLRQNKITDISSLVHNKKLRELYLSDNNIVNISDVPKNITEFGATRNQIKNISGLKNAPHLRSLALKNNQINNITYLRKLVKLEEIYLDNNDIKDIEPLEQLTKLNRLWISSNPIKSFKPLQGLTSLRRLRMQKVGIVDLDHLNNLTEMEHLNLTGNEKITDISPLSGMDKLISLYFWGSKIKNLHIIENFQSLTDLTLNNCGVENLDFLRSNHEIKHLKLESNNIRSLSSIAHLNLVDLNVRENPIDKNYDLYSLEKNCPTSGVGAVRDYCLSKRNRPQEQTQ